MKLLWLCNMAPGAVQAAMDGKKTSGLWVDHVLSDLRKEARETASADSWMTNAALPASPRGTPMSIPRPRSPSSGRSWRRLDPM